MLSKRQYKMLQQGTMRAHQAEISTMQAMLQQKDQEAAVLREEFKVIGLESYNVFF